MNIISDFFNITKLNDLKLKQLKAQEKADHQISIYFKKHCPENTINFFLQIREKSRKDQQKIIDADMLDKFSAINDEVTQSIEIYKRVDSIVNSPVELTTKCTMLNKVILP